MNEKTSIGSIYAYIGGDYRYGSCVQALYNHESRQVVVQFLENGAVGGMDGPGGAYGYEVRSEVALTNPSPAMLVKTIKSLFDSTIVRYGTPSKKFRWCTDAKGLSSDKAAKALEMINAYAQADLDA